MTTPDHKPFIPATESPAEFTLKAIITGSVFGVLFGAATVYLSLKAGLSVSAPADRLEEAWIDRVKGTAARISQALGYRG